MIGVLTHHWAKVDRIDEARKLLDRNGEAQSKAPGFVSRQTLIALADAAKITTLVVWTTNDIYEAWRASPQRTIAMSGADQLWARPPESERFQMVGCSTRIPTSSSGKCKRSSSAGRVAVVCTGSASGSRWGSWKSSRRPASEGW